MIRSQLTTGHHPIIRVMCLSSALRWGAAVLLMNERPPGIDIAYWITWTPSVLQYLHLYRRCYLWLTCFPLARRQSFVSMILYCPGSRLCRKVHSWSSWASAGVSIPKVSRLKFFTFSVWAFGSVNTGRKPAARENAVRNGTQPSTHGRITLLDLCGSSLAKALIGDCYGRAWYQMMNHRYNDL